MRWVGAGLLSLVGGLLGLVGVLLCVTIVLAPLGLLVLMLARRLFRSAGQVALPRRVRHPVSALADTASDAVQDLGTATRKRGRWAARRARKTAKRLG